MIRYFKNKSLLEYLKSREGKILIIILGFFILEVNAFAYIENLTLVDAIYFTIVTLGTVGYGDIHPTSTLGRIFASLFIVVNILILAFLLAR